MATLKPSTRSSQAPLIWLGAVCLVMPLAALGWVLVALARFRRSTHKARRLATLASEQGTPRVTYDHAGRMGDPLNIEIQATAAQIEAAFAAVGWYRADERDLFTSARIVVDTLLKRPYSSAPVSNLFLFGRKEDLAFERPGTNARQRDHIRLWKTSTLAIDQRPIWLGAATYDSKIELAKSNHLPTHGIAPDLDGERELVVSELALSGFLIAESHRPGLGPTTHGFNGGGDLYYTDGKLASLVLANVPTLTLPGGIRSPLGVRLARPLAG